MSSTEEGEKVTSSTCITPTNDVSEHTADESYASRGRSRRPTLAGPNAQVFDQTRPSADSGALELARKEKWTVKRIFKVTWAYVTTLKVFSAIPQH